MPPALEHSSVIQEVIATLFHELQDCREGEVATYIPELAKADPEAFGIVMTTVDGRTYAMGDVDIPFTIQSISKPFLYGLALETLSQELMHTKVGVEPSGDAFNAISLDPQSGIPRNPMINAGAIATTAQVWHHDPQGAEERTLAFFSALAGRPLAVDEAVYRSERDTGHRNRAISHLLRNAAVIEHAPEEGLDLYFRQCAIAVTCRDLAVMAATLACQGRHPLTGAQPLTPSTTTSLLAVMGSCGMYDFAGQWLYDVGLPAKSGVAGGVLAVVPGRLGLAVYSPRLDALGNSVRGIEVCRRLSRRFDLHLFNRSPLHQSPVRNSYRGTERRSRCWRSEAETQRLDGLRSRLAILHAQGVLDFAAMEVLLSTMEATTADTSVWVLDLGQVNELLPAAAGLLARAVERLAAADGVVLLCRASHLPLPGLMEKGPPFDSLDLALEAAEHHLLVSGSSGEGKPGAPAPGPFDPRALFHWMAAEPLEALMALLVLQPYGAGERVINRGEGGEQLYIVAAGRFTVSFPLPHRGPSPSMARMATYSAGMVFGDAAFLAQKPRQADVVAETDGACWCLNRAELDRLEATHPAAALGLLRMLALDLGGKVTLCAQQLTLVEHL
ncbi:MAG: glutaminase A [Cyanobium sp.]